MLNAVIGNDILDGLFGMLPSGSGIPSYVNFSGSVYLGLLTKLPKPNGEIYEDGTYFTEMNGEGYQRVQLDANSRISGKYIMADAIDEDVVKVGSDNALPASIQNQALLIFPENSIEQTVVGFGLFRSRNVADRITLPFLWGAVTGTDGSDSILIKAEEVPIVREGGFKISLM